MMEKPKVLYEAERAVLGAVLLNGQALKTVRGILGDCAGAFDDKGNQSIYEAMIDLEDAGKPIDAVTLKNALRETEKLEKVGGISFIAELSGSVPISANAEHYALIVYEASQRRGMETLTRKTKTMLDRGEPLETVLNDWKKLIQSFTNEAGELQTVCMADVEAERTGAGVLIVRHLNKSSGGNVIYRGGGSIGIIAAARVGLLAAKHPQDDAKRILAITKCNLGPQAPALDYVIDADPDRNVSRVKWGFTNQYQAQQLISEPTERGTAVDEAVDFLKDCLRAGPVAAIEVQRQAGQACIASITLRRAKEKLRVKPRKEGRPGEPGRWIWELPENCESPESPEDVQGASKALTPGSEPLHENLSTFDPSTGT